jgi:hypothetical protein
LKLSHIAGFWECNNSFVSMVQPVYPSWTIFAVHMRPYAQGSLDKEGDSYWLYLAEILRCCRINFLAFATDGNRGNLAYEQALFSSSREILDDSVSILKQVQIVTLWG